MLALIPELEQKRAVLQSLARLIRERLENEDTTVIQWWDTACVAEFTLEEMASFLTGHCDLLTKIGNRLHGS